MRTSSLLPGAVLALLLATTGRPQPADPAAAATVPPAPTTPPLSAFAAFGSSLALSGHFAQLGWTEDQFNAFLNGIRATYHGQPVPMDDAGRELAGEIGRKIQDLSSSPPPAAVSAPVPNPQQLEAYFRSLTKRLGLQWSADGLGYNLVAGNSGVRPRPGDTVVLSCHAVAADGVTKLPRLSSDRFQTRMDGLLPGLREGLQMMTVGSQAVFVLPAKLSFGTGAWPDGVQPGSPLLFQIVLQEVVPAATSP